MRLLGMFDWALSPTLLLLPLPTRLEFSGYTLPKVNFW